MPRRNSSQRRKAKTILRLTDLEQSKNAVLHSLAATTSQESYDLDREARFCKVPCYFGLADMP